MQPVLISLVGPTAVGKTGKAIEMAQILKTEILSCDSRQFYREMTIGTAKPTPSELRDVRHYFINTHSVDQYYSAGSFERDAIQLLRECFKDRDTMIMVGGSGLYAKALWQGFDEMPEIHSGVREELNRAFSVYGLQPLLDELRQSDPAYFKQVDKQNHQRIIRALEVIRSTGRPFSKLRNNTRKDRFFKNVKIGLELDREALYARIDQRMDEMIEKGLFEEARGLFHKKDLNALQTVGYQEIFGYLDGRYDQEEAFRLLKRNSRRYAKRQMTWFKADPEIKWFDASLSAKDILISLQLL